MRSGAIAAAVALLVVACRDKDAPAPAASASVAPSAPPSASAQEPDDIRANYPLTDAATDDVAVRYCAIVHQTPERRRAECCASKPRPTASLLCEQALSQAARAKAVTLVAAEVVACEGAMAKKYEGCEWVGPSAGVALPEACKGLLHGTLAAGARCRSSSECAKTLRCRGAGPTDLGTCAEPLDDGAACGNAVDPLASYTLQPDDSLHPECKGVCFRHRCAGLKPEGTACTSQLQCGRDKACVGGKCAAPPSKVGEACPGGECGGELVCVDGKCAARKAAGAACAADFECVGACVKADGGARGTCGRRCGLF